MASDVWEFVLYKLPGFEAYSIHKKLLSNLHYFLAAMCHHLVLLFCRWANANGWFTVTGTFEREEILFFTRQSNLYCPKFTLSENSDRWRLDLELSYEITRYSVWHKVLDNVSPRVEILFFNTMMPLFSFRLMNLFVAYSTKALFRFELEQKWLNLCFGIYQVNTRSIELKSLNWWVWNPVTFFFQLNCLEETLSNLM